MKISITFEGNSTAEVVTEMIGYIENLGSFTVAHVEPEAPAETGSEAVDAE